MTAKVYDPLGIVSPALLSVKAMLQEKTTVVWDDPDPDKTRCLQEFTSGFQLVSQFLLLCFCKPDSDSFDKPNQVSIHGLSDARNIGYSAVIYL